ncbi:arginine repressor [Lactococcus fujiensis]|uniref:Arginine repressor n=1 Tax=Lactococcus fujiensis JCM 16395 TaxID=1291764 RepID=A0A2A5RKA8_9LACT|nr:arginine repressor [Lactococcus fujiensis]PCR99625.1 arginine repressor [Lactococcus fujiensis JCM 16395]
MKRAERLTLITSIITSHQIATQEDLQVYLEREGVEITQATLSRDIRELNIIKKRENGKSFYSFLADENKESHTDLQMHFARFVVKVAAASVIVVVHTHLGEADLLANAIDSENRPSILGTIAGADTLLITCISETAATALLTEIEDAIQ